MPKKQFLFLIIIFLIIINCKEKPGPISVENKITPTVVSSGDYVTWEIIVTNMGGKVRIERVHCREEVISGWAAGTYAEMDIPLSKSEVKSHSAEIIHAQTSPVLNIGPTDIQLKNTVTVFSNGGTDSDECIYTIKTPYYSNFSAYSIIKTFFINPNME
ncbi:MAG: hypothetical protein NC926_11145 [Candidatus Omnitrophica bacterium]|nr:hypothetical protein [Candidatus Omnitrophota bacterium]